MNPVSIKVEDQIEAQYSAIQSRINELEPGKLRAYNELLSKYVPNILLSPLCTIWHFQDTQVNLSCVFLGYSTC